MNIFQQTLDVVLHIDKYINTLTAEYGVVMYIILFAVVFAETGLVVMPFLPGDSLLFAAGAVCASGGMNVWLLILLLCIAAILGDAVNYAIGRKIGPSIFYSSKSRFLNKKHLERAHVFYEKHGGKTIIIARFLPIIRTFAPFVAGIGQMSYSRFALYNVVGALAWVFSFTLLGYWFADTEIVKKNFSLLILGMMVISILPTIIELIRARRKSTSA